MKNNIVAFIAGLVFAVGLGIAGMTQPSKVIGFLDFFGEWDPSLMFVMGGGIAAHFLFARKAVKGGAPRFALKFELPTRRDIDAKLLLGAALFGIGWGIGGLCPGPALVGLMSGAPTTLLFVAAMITSMFAYRWLARPRPAADVAVERVA
jgi:uncharacterized membrane protein YedE/YeeE